MTKPTTPAIRKRSKLPPSVNLCARSYTLARSRLNLALTKHLVEDFDVHGAEMIATLRRDKPVDYVKLVNAILGDEAGGQAIDATYHTIERRIVRPGDIDC